MECSKTRCVALCLLCLGSTASGCHEGTPFGPLDELPAEGDGGDFSGNASGGSATGGVSRTGDGDADVGDGDISTGGFGGGGADGTEGESPIGTAGGGDIGMGGRTAEEPPTEAPPRTFSAGRLPFETRVCWAIERGGLSLSDWTERRELYQAVIDEWTVGTGLQLLWSDACAPPNSVGVYEEELRILLSDGVGAGPTEGCEEQPTEASWFVAPEELGRYQDCAWNLSLDVELPAKSLLLHLTGHALGLVHHHFGARLDCPLDAPLERSWSPYLEEVDTDSVLLRGFNNDPAHAEEGCHLTDEWDDGTLSSGDRLSIQMLYPPSTERRLLPVGSAVVFDGYWVFPEEQPLWFEYAWLTSGAQPDWFWEPTWETRDPNSSLRFGGTGLEGGFFIDPGRPMDVTLQFVDPFGDTHSGSTQVEVSNVKHAAMVSTFL